MEFNGSFKITNKNEFYKKVKDAVSIKARNAIDKTIKDFFAIIIVGKMNKKWIYETNFIRWMLSEEGLGFLGWKPNRVNYQIERMSQLVEKNWYTSITRNIASIGIAPLNRMADELAVNLIRRNQETGGLYRFAERWFEWLVEGYFGNPQYVVAYAMGRGESGLAYMQSKNRELRQNVTMIKRNRIRKMENPYVEATRVHGKDITDFLVARLKRYMR